MARSKSSKVLTQNFISGLLLGFLVTFYILFILVPAVMPERAVAPVRKPIIDYR